MPLDEAYFKWLYSQVGSVENRNLKKTYWKLLRLLYKTEFTWSIEKDGNRAQDGKDLRIEFLHEAGIKKADQEPGWLDLGCSMLELMIALSWMLAFDGGGELRDWFWQLIDNLGLKECTDATQIDERIIEEILDRVITRNYSNNGAGGLFPLSNPNKDQRGVELQYQAQAYLLERL